MMVKLSQHPLIYNDFKINVWFFLLRLACGLKL